MIIIWCMVPEICSMTEFLSFWALFFFFFALLPHYWLWKLKFGKNVKNKQDMCTINEDHMMYSSWDIRHNEQSFLSFWVIFPLWPPNNPKNEIWKKWRKKKTWRYHHITQVYHKWQSYDVWLPKTPGDIIISHNSTINDNHMVRAYSRDLGHICRKNRCHF